MNRDASKDRLKQFLPSEEELDRAMREAMREGAQGLTDAGAPNLRTLRTNSLVKGKVLAVDMDRVTVDLSYKAEGVIPAHEFGTTPPKVGSEVEAWVMELSNADGQVPLSVIEAQRRQVWESMSTEAGSKKILTARVTEAVKGGLVVDIGVRAFLPAKELDVRYVEDLAPFVGKSIEVRVLEVDQKERRVIVSRRSILKERQLEDRAKLFESLEVGQTRHGVVTNITDFGAFVDIGGAEGLLHKGDLAWGRVEKVRDIVDLGQEIDVVVLTFDRSSGKIGLGMKQAGPSPWDAASERYAQGRRAKGKVVGILDFGAIVELEPGVQGMVHVSEMSWSRRVRRPEDAVQLGDEVEVEVLALDLDRKKLSLSMKKVEENPYSSLADRYPFATIVKGTVSELADFGAFIQLADGVEGLVHVSEISWSERINHPKELLHLGDPVTAIVIGCDPARERLSLSIKKTEPDPWWDVAERYPAGKRVRVKVARFSNFGAFVEVEKGLEGLIHVSNMGRGMVHRPEDAVRIGATVLAEVLEADEGARKMGLRLLDDDMADD
jgi:small subunit ribosomal protein S1